MLGEKLAASKRATYSLIVPVPLHKKRQRKRGYNQVVGFAKALAQRLNIP
jgi:predicted amidophosphoribosyltransferase